MLQKTPIATVVSLILAIACPTVQAQFRREPKPDVKPQVDPHQVAVIMSHGIDHSDSGDPVFVEFSPDSQMMYVAGPIGPVPTAPLARYMKDGGGIGNITSATRDAVEDGTSFGKSKGFSSTQQSTALTGFRTSDWKPVRHFVCQPEGKQRPEYVRSADLSPDGKYLTAVGAMYKGFYLFDAATGRQISYFDTVDRRSLELERAVFVTVGESLHVLSQKSGVLLLHSVPAGTIVDKVDLSDPKLQYLGHISATMNGKLFGVGASVWDAEKAEVVSLLSERSSGDTLLSPQGDDVLIGYGDRMLRWNRKDDKPVVAFRDESRKRITAFAVSADQRFIAVACGDLISRDKISLDVFDYKTEKPLRQFTGHVSTIHAMAFSPDGKLLASVSRDGSTRVWTLADL